MKHKHKLSITVYCNDCKADFKVELYKNSVLKQLILWNRYHRKHDKSLHIFEI